MAEDNVSSTSFLSIPSRISRSASHESFATDASVISLCSFTSEFLPNNIRSRRKDDDEDLEDPEMVRHRENILEKMLESHSLNVPKLSAGAGSGGSRSRQGSNTSSAGGNRKESAVVQPALTDSEEDLLDACADDCQRQKGSLYKCFSTTDLVGFSTPLGIKHCTSQALIPSNYVQMLQSRRKHLGDLQRLDAKALQSQCRDLFMTTPSGGGLFLGGLRGGDKPEPEYKVSSPDQRRSTSEENLPYLQRRITAGTPFMRKLKFSKEIGRKIRDDLLKKLGKHKHRLATKLDLDKDKGRPVTKLERNLMIFHWLQSLDEDSFDEP